MRRWRRRLFFGFFSLLQRLQRRRRRVVCVLRGFEELLPEMPNRGLSAVALCRENLMPQTPRVHFFGERGDYAAERRELAVQLLLLLCQGRDSRQYLHF